MSRFRYRRTRSAYECISSTATGRRKAWVAKPHQVLFDVLGADLAGTKHQPMAFGRPLIDEGTFDLDMMNAKGWPFIICEEILGHRLNIFNLCP